MSERERIYFLTVPFYRQILSYLYFCLREFIKIVRLPLAAVSINGLTTTHLTLSCLLHGWVQWALDSFKIKTCQFKLRYFSNTFLKANGCAALLYYVTVFRQFGCLDAQYQYSDIINIPAVFHGCQITLFKLLR